MERRVKERSLIAMILPASLALFSNELGYKCHSGPNFCAATTPLQPNILMDAWQMSRHFVWGGHSLSKKNNGGVEKVSMGGFGHILALFFVGSLDLGDWSGFFAAFLA